MSGQRNPSDFAWRESILRGNTGTYCTMYKCSNDFVRSLTNCFGILRVNDTHTNTHINTHINTNINTHMNTHTDTLTHTYTHAHTLSHTHTHTTQKTMKCVPLKSDSQVIHPVSVQQVRSHASPELTYIKNKMRWDRGVHVQRNRGRKREGGERSSKNTHTHTHQPTPPKLCSHKQTRTLHNINLQAC